MNDGKIKEISPTSEAAAHAQIMTGDKLLTINGRPIEETDDVINLVRSASRTSTFTFWRSEGIRSNSS